MPKKILYLLSLLLLLYSCRTIRTNLDKVAAIEGMVLHTGIIDCFEEGLLNPDGTPVFCEASAITKMDNRLLIAIDKPMPAGKGLSTVFSVPLSEIRSDKINRSLIQYALEQAFQNVIKIEALTQAEDGRFFAATAFDRIKSSTPDWDGYNALLSWNGAEFENLQYLDSITTGSFTSSKNLRKAFQKVLTTNAFPNGVPYFKVEALAALPGNRLIFGIRELGESYLKFDYTFTLIEANYTRTPNGILIQPDFKRLYDFQPFVEGQPLGISDLIYHADSKSLLALTSYEESIADESKKTFYTYLWVLPLSKMAAQQAPIPIKTATGTALQLPHKGEGLCLLDDKTLLIIHDEDRKPSTVQLATTTTTRQPHQAVYSIVRLKW